jgi:hypothetical protein
MMRNRIMKMMMIKRRRMSLQTVTKQRTLERDSQRIWSFYTTIMKRLRGLLLHRCDLLLQQSK